MQPTSPFGAPEQQPNIPAPEPVMAPPVTTPQVLPQSTPPVVVPPPAFPSPVATMQPMPQKSGRNSKMLKMIAVIGGGLLAIGLITFVAFSMFAVSKEDYGKASTAAEDARVAYNKMGSGYISSSSTETEIRNDLDTIKSARTTFDDKFKQLGSMKAVTADKEVRELYEAAKTKKPKFDTAMGAMIEMYEKIMPAVASGSSSSSGGSETLRKMRLALEGIQGLTDETNKQFVSGSVGRLKKMEELAVKVEAGRADYRQYDSKASSTYYEEYNAYTRDVRDWQSNMEKKFKDGDLHDEMTKLADKLFEKSLKK